MGPEDSKFLQPPKKFVISYKFISLLFLILILFIVTGYFVFKQNFPIVSEKTVLPVQTQETDNWKTYTNKYYGFEFKYPSDLDFTGAEDFSVATINQKGRNDKSAEISLFINFNNKNITAESLAKDSPFLDSYTLMNINGIEVARSKESGDGGSVVNTYIPLQNKTYLLIGVRNEDYTEVYDQILSTFKFIYTTPKLTDEWTIPPNGYSWQIVDDKNKIFTGSQVFYDDQKNKYGSLNFNGTEWVFKTDNINAAPILPDSAEGDKIMMERSGWFEELNYNGYRITPLMADGPGSSDWGYVKLQNNKLNVLLFNRRVYYYGPMIEHGDEEPTFNCPCTFESRVFLGEPIDVNSVLPK
jgi:hypothetical protein